MSGTTEQERFWREDFGDAYIERNQGALPIAAQVALFGKILGSMHNVKSVLELGSNIGLNLAALSVLLPVSKLSAVEINEKAATEVRKNFPHVQMHHASILDFEPGEKSDLVFTKGVLIHINPERLPEVYDVMYRASNRYILVAEYYNPVPTEIPYRGHSGKLFKRDFAGDILDRFSDLQLIDYGFAYRRDPNFPQDDLTWFLMEKT